MRVQCLLDVNVLVALFWPQHVKHQAAKDWFQQQVGVRGGWATCAITQAGFVRVLSNPVVNQGALSALRTTLILEENLKRPGHSFWCMDVSWPEALRLSGAVIEGFQQVTDLYLIGLAVKHKGRLVTFDRALGKMSESVVVI